MSEEPGGAQGPAPMYDRPGVTLLIGPFVLAAFVVGQLMALMVVQFVAAAAGAPHAADGPGIPAAVRLSFAHLAGGALALTAIWASTQRGPMDAREPVLRGALGRVRPSWIVLALIAAPCVSVLAADLEALARILLPQPAVERELYLRTFFPTDVLVRLLTAVGTVVVAPIIEELVFRGALRRALARRYGTLAAAAFTAALFAVAHMSLRAGPIFFVLGFANAVLAERTGGLAVPILVHAVYNGTFYLLPQRWLLEPRAFSGETPRGPWLVAATAALLLAAAGTALSAVLPKRRSGPLE